MTFATIILDKIPYFIPQDLYASIESFLVWDKNSMKYAIFRSNQPEIKNIHRLIHNGKTRKNGFNGNYDTEDEHWVFSYHNVQLQAINCAVCGNYILTNTDTIPIRISCMDIH